MFGFMSKFKQDVTSGFDSVHQRLVTLEAKVEALFHHVNSVPAAIESIPAKVEAAIAATPAAVEAIPSEVVAEVKNAS